MNTVEFLLKNITLPIIFNKSVTYLQEKNKKIKKISLLIITSCSSWGLIFSLPNSAQEFRSFDGSRNNLINQNWGIAGSQLIRLTSAKYDDGISAPAGKERPSARIISNLIGSQSTSIPNSLQVTNWFWQWGQFLDHDLGLTPPHSPLETFDIAVPQADLFFDPQGSGRQTIGFNRSLYINRGIRQQINEITSYIDASMIYGSDQLRASTLRANDGTGKLKVSSGNLLMLNEVGLANDGGNSPDLFLSGDIRVNENIGLTATHTLFFREHNRLATEILAKLHQQEPILTQQFQASNLSQAEFIYQTARKIVGAQIQVITYQEFLPL
ncbi:MAG: peroxiredoxin, partial [Cyanobacteria bacterium J083]